MDASLLPSNRLTLIIQKGSILLLGHCRHHAQHPLHALFGVDQSLVVGEKQMVKGHTEGPKVCRRKYPQMRILSKNTIKTKRIITVALRCHDVSESRREIPKWKAIFLNFK